MSFYVLSFLLWPIALFKFGLSQLSHRFFRAVAALLVSVCGFAGYAIVPYRLLIVSYYFPLPMWVYVAVPVAYLAGYFLYWQIDDSPMLSLM